MNKHVEEYHQIVNDMIRKSFPSLKNRKIFIFEITHPIYPWSWASALSFLGMNLICVNPRTRRLDYIAKKSIFVHELCHIEDFRKNAKKHKTFLLYKYLKILFNRSYASEIEKQADIKSIKKGYGKELLYRTILITKIESKKMREKRRKMGYLTSKEIRAYMKKFKNQKNLNVK